MIGRKIISILFLLFLFPNPGSTHKLPYEIQWKSEFLIKSNTRVLSETKLSKQQKRKTSEIYLDIERMFLRKFEPSLSCSPKELLQIRIVGRNTLQNKKIFANAGIYDFGRYFSDVNYLYISPEFFIYPEYLAHEMAHYYYDECEKTFDNLKDEHIMAYRFQYLYKNRRKE